jgi:hypothetical protein
LIILATVTLARSNNALPDDGDYTETCRAVLMSISMKILKLFLRQFTCAPAGKKKLC